jgi:hypothetical protein
MSHRSGTFLNSPFQVGLPVIVLTELEDDLLLLSLLACHVKPSQKYSPEFFR